MAAAIPGRVIFWFGLGLAILVFNGLIAYRTITSLAQATRSVEEGVQVVERLRGVSSAVADSEAGQRGYIISQRGSTSSIPAKYFALQIARWARSVH